MRSKGGFAKSGMTRREYCAKHGVGISTLDHWRRAHRKQKPKLVQVTLRKPSRRRRRLASRWCWSTVGESRATGVLLRRSVFGLGLATKIYVAVEAVDMRKGFEGLYGLVRDQLVATGGTKMNFTSTIANQPSRSAPGTFAERLAESVAAAKYESISEAAPVGSVELRQLTARTNLRYSLIFAL